MTDAQRSAPTRTNPQRGTERSNPVCSSGESTSRAILPSHGEKPAFARACGPGRCSAVSRDGYRAVHGADRWEYLCRAKFQYRGVDEAVAE
jgi:hypothetical protein